MVALAALSSYTSSAVRFGRAKTAARLRSPRAKALIAEPGAWLTFSWQYEPERATSPRASRAASASASRRCRSTGPLDSAGGVGEDALSIDDGGPGGGHGCGRSFSGVVAMGYRWLLTHAMVVAMHL